MLFASSIQSIDAFIHIADLRFGPITKIRRAGQKTKVIRWSAFQFSGADWERIRLCADILAVRLSSSILIPAYADHPGIQDANKYHQLSSTTRSPTLHQVIPTLESLASRWERKLENPVYAPFRQALEAGLAKLNKYYLKLDDCDAYILALCTSPDTASLP